MGGFSFTPEQLVKSIRTFMPEAEVTYSPDERQKIAETWPMSIDDSLARRDWGWSHHYDIEKTTQTMLRLVKNQMEASNVALS